MSGCPTDVIFAMDMSSSMDELGVNAAKAMIADIVSSLPVGEHDVHIGVVTYTTIATAVLELTDSYDRDTIKSAILNATYQGGSGCAFNGMVAVRDMFDDSGTPGNEGVVVFVTDGQDACLPADTYKLSEDLKLTADLYALRKCAIVSRNSHDRQCMTRSFPV